ncbi:MAG: hypothetical protein M3N57_08020 [Actinomycetota bacterium]|nr:hypothetical protein [Actinomycetota bacterium]
MATTSIQRRSMVAGSAIALLVAWMVAPTGAAAHPGAHPGGEQQNDGLGVRVNSPAELAGFFPAVQWDGTGDVEGQTRRPRLRGHRVHAGELRAGRGRGPGQHRPR